MIGFFTNTISNITTVRLDEKEIHFNGQLGYDEYIYAVRNGFAEPNGQFIKFSADGEKKFFIYIKDLMTKNGTLRNKKGNKYN